ncbi:hydrogenase/urease nickel incorporation protein HypA [Shigella flexneri]
MALCQRALELIPQRRPDGAKRVTGVWLSNSRIFLCRNQLSCLLFDSVCRGSVAEGCDWHLKEQEAECWCETCQQYVTLLTQRVRRCPQCHGDMLQIVADDGLDSRIEIDQE